MWRTAGSCTGTGDLRQQDTCLLPLQTGMCKSGDLCLKIHSDCHSLKGSMQALPEVHTWEQSTQSFGKY